MVVNLFPRQFQPNGLRGAFSLAYLSSYFNVEGRVQKQRRAGYCRVTSSG